MNNYIESNEQQLLPRKLDFDKYEIIKDCSNIQPTFNEVGIKLDGNQV